MSAELPVRNRPVHSLSEALARPGVRVVMECKKASPSAGILRKMAGVDVVVDAYDGVADAISVLTDAERFGGSLADLSAVAARVSVPVLRKDFILDPRQVVEAHAHGADAVLLMLSLLDDDGYRACATAAHRCGIEVLTEVHDEDELERAIALDAAVIGVNNRSFADLSVDLDVTRRLAPRIPDDRIVVCESGITSNADIRDLAGLADAFLVGSALMRAPRIDLAARELLFGRVKVCGLTREEDARAAWNAGARYGGVVFAPGSPRQVTPARAAAIAGATPMPMVGVFVDEKPATIARTVEEAGLAVAQLHGREDADAIAAVRAALPDDVAVWKAVCNGTTPPAGADLYLFDAQSPGGGRPFDWNALPHDMSRHGLAGGLDAANVGAALATGAALLDVSSGVESAPGIKSPERLGAFFDAIRSAQA